MKSLVTNLVIWLSASSAIGVAIGAVGIYIGETHDVPRGARASADGSARALGVRHGRGAT